MLRRIQQLIRAQQLIRLLIRPTINLQLNNKPPTVVGNYKLIEKTDDGVTLNEGQITSQNKGRTLEVKADGIATKKEADGDVETYKYDAEKFIENDGDVKIYTFDSNTNTLRVNDGNDVYVYQKV